MTSSPRTSPHCSKPFLGGQHGRSVLVPPIHELEEEHRAGVIDRQVADLVDDEEGRMREHGEPLRQSSRGLSLLERGDQIDQGAVVHPSSALRGGDRQVRLADARRAEQHDVLLALEEAELMQALDLLALDRRLERAPLNSL
jgi:hypothetical protein